MFHTKVVEKIITHNFIFNYIFFLNRTIYENVKNVVELERLQVTIQYSTLTLHA